MLLYPPKLISVFFTFNICVLLQIKSGKDQRKSRALSLSLFAPSLYNSSFPESHLRIILKELAEKTQV
nr:hypothetical protein CFP56_50231 [Quercus suber]